MKNILVTGGAGFIGSHMAERLLKEGYGVIILDNFNDYYSSDMKRKNIEEIREHLGKTLSYEERLYVIEGDIRDSNLLENIFKRNIDMVIHLAAMAGVRYSIENPQLYFDVNVNGTLKLIEGCKNNRVRRFIFASSSSVYGNSCKVPFCEEDQADQPLSPYGASKRAGELICYTNHHLYNMSIACLRFFTVYGPRQRPDLAIRKFTKLMMENKEIPFYGDGSSERDYTYIDDIIDGIFKTVNWLYENDHKFEIFNLGESNPISLKDMVRTIERQSGLCAKIKKLPEQKGDVDKTFADINKANRILNYKPSTDFDEGIRKFVEWLRVNMEEL